MFSEAPSIHHVWTITYYLTPQKTFRWICALLSVNMDNNVTTTTKATRFRLSCDACSAAKVKCDKKRPACDRCTNNEIPCQYSASRRSGKLSWEKRLAAERERKAAAAERPSVPTSETRLSQVANSLACTAPTLPTPRQSRGSETYPSLGEDNDLESPGPGGYFDPRHFWSQHEFPAEFDFASLEDPFRLSRSTHASLDCGYVESLPETSPGTTSQASASTHVPAHGAASLCASSLAGSLRTQLRTNEQASLPGKQHDCESRAVSVLLSLRHCTSPEDARGSCSDADYLAAQSNVLTDPIPSLDEVVLANKAALSHWSELMRCRCAQSPHATLLYISLLSKILFWYRIAVDANCTSAGTCSTNNATGALASPPEEVDPTPIKVRPTIIRIGMLDLDQDDQANLARVMLLRELNKVGKIIDEVTAQYPFVDDAGDKNDSSKIANCLKLGISHLRSELERLIQLLE